MIPLALFGSVVPMHKRCGLADKLLSIQPTAPVDQPLQRFGTGFGKPAFPVDITESTTLPDLVGPDLWYTMHILQLDTSFLEKEVASWPGCATTVQSVVLSSAQTS